jgi:hypothetical protein
MSQTTSSRLQQAGRDRSSSSAVTAAACFVAAIAVGATAVLLLA